MNDLFAGNSNSFIQLDVPDANFFYYSNFLTEDESSDLFSFLRTNVDWQQQYAKFPTHNTPLPRLTQWYGDLPYFYSGILNPPKEMPEEIFRLKQKIEDACHINLNSVLLNFYRNGNDSVSFHRDNEKGMGENPTVASVSLGAERLFRIKHLVSSKTSDLFLENGSLLVMGNQSQIKYAHTLPKTKENVGERINLTFRKMI